jgi:hypothetical protein
MGEKDKESLKYIDITKFANYYTCYNVLYLKKLERGGCTGASKEVQHQ